MPCGGIEACTGLVPCVLGRLTAPEADDCHLEERGDLDSLGRDLLATGRVGLQAEAMADFALDRADLLGGRLFTLGDLDGRAGLAAECASSSGMGEGGQPGGFIKTEVDNVALASADRRAISAPAMSPSIPLWVYPNRCSSRTTVSPLAVNRKCPGSMMPACTGPTAI